MLPLGLRNRLAELILSAFDDPDARQTLGSLDAFCRSPDGAVGPAATARLAALGWFDAAGDGRVRLRGAHGPHRAALCRRVTAAATALASGPTGRGADPTAVSLARAAGLADAGLCFEVHELLEPLWMAADGGRRVALQGLIQVAVALHHAQHDNRDGAISLLAEALPKLGATRGLLPLDTAAWEMVLAALLVALRAGAPIPPLPPWPRPAGTGAALAT
jgi:hypothetical protein